MRKQKKDIKYLKNDVGELKSSVSLLENILEKKQFSYEGFVELRDQVYQYLGQMDELFESYESRFESLQSLAEELEEHYDSKEDEWMDYLERLKSYHAELYSKPEQEYLILDEVFKLKSEMKSFIEKSRGFEQRQELKFDELRSEMDRILGSLEYLKQEKHEGFAKRVKSMSGGSPEQDQLKSFFGKFFQSILSPESVELSLEPEHVSDSYKCKLKINEILAEVSRLEEAYSIKDLSPDDIRLAESLIIKDLKQKPELRESLSDFISPDLEFYDYPFLFDEFKKQYLEYYEHEFDQIGYLLYYKRMEEASSYSEFFYKDKHLPRIKELAQKVEQLIEAGFTASCKSFPKALKLFKSKLVDTDRLYYQDLDCKFKFSVIYKYLMVYYIDYHDRLVKSLEQ